MQSAIRIQPEKNHINVWCTYNTELVEIFNELNGWWRKDHWIFPLYLKDKLVDTLEEKGYKTISVPEFGKWRKQSKTDFSYDPAKEKKTKPVWGLCKQCNTKAYVNKDCLCEKCV